MTVSLIRRLFAAFNIAVLLLAATNAAPVMAAAGAMHRECAFCRAGSTADRGLPKMPPCGIPACAAAAIVATAPGLAALPPESRVGYAIGPGAARLGSPPKAELPPPRPVLPF